MDSSAVMPAIIHPSRSARLASWLALLYFFGGFGWLIFRAATETGIYGAVVAWEESNGHSDRFTPFLPGLVLWYVPILIFDHLPSDHSPAIRAGQEFFKSLSRPQPTTHEVIRANLDDENFGQRTTRFARNAALIAMALGFGLAGIIQVIGSEGAGQPIPLLTLSELLATDPNKIPDYVILTGAVAHPELAWVNSYTIRHTDYNDYYIPRTAPAWTPSQSAPVSVIELDPYGSDSAANVEGELSVNSLDGWMPKEIGKMGWSVAPTVYVVNQDPLLNGVVPGPDRISQCMCMIMGVFVAIVFLSAGFTQKRRWKKDREIWGDNPDYRNPYGDK